MHTAEGEDSSRLKIKVRRLYDIANVLAAVQLLEKVSARYARKPSYRWIGALGVVASIEATTEQAVLQVDPVTARHAYYGANGSPAGFAPALAARAVHMQVPGQVNPMRLRAACICL